MLILPERFPLWGRYGFDRDRLSSGRMSRLRLVKRYSPKYNWQI